MKVMKILNKYMKPFLIEHGFKYEGKRGGDEPCFIHKDYDKARIFFSFVTCIKPFSIQTEVYGGAYDNPSIDLFLTDLLNGPSKVAQIINTGKWYFDTEEELVGILEYQAELFKLWVFDWMLGKVYTEIDIYKKKDLIVEKRGKVYDSCSEEEQEIIESEAFKIFNEWKTKRFYPVNWKL